jgi:hypothetical protein
MFVTGKKNIKIANIVLVINYLLMIALNLYFFEYFITELKKGTNPCQPCATESILKNLLSHYPSILIV